jgi:diaminopimelate epimerase
MKKALLMLGMAAKKARVNKVVVKHFYKYNAAGNDFVLLESEPPKMRAKLSEEVANLCARHSGVGGDGIIYLWKEKSNKYFWRFFNQDASETSLCGNAARCVGLHLSKKYPKKKEWTWEGALGKFRGRKKGTHIEVSWPLAFSSIDVASDRIMEDLVGFNDRGLAAAYHVQVGVPHLVLINFEVWNPPDRFANNPYLRRHPSLDPEGANITWLSLKTLEAVTFERGVENETLACGSGALSAFLAYQFYCAEQKAKVPKLLKLNFPGGELQVSHQARSEFWLGGPTRLVFEGDV